MIFLLKKNTLNSLLTIPHNVQLLYYLGVVFSLNTISTNFTRIQTFIQEMTRLKSAIKAKPFLKKAD